MAEPHHNISLSPGWDTVADLEREGEAWGRFMAEKVGLPLLRVKGGKTYPAALNSAMVGLIDGCFSKNWNETMAKIRAELPPQQAQIFENAARKGVALRYAEDLTGARGA
jgi:hypothetical protein